METIRYCGPARMLNGKNVDFEDWQWVHVDVEPEAELEVLEHALPNVSRHVPLPFLVVIDREQNVYVIEDDVYCSYAGICMQCRSPNCDKQCVPDWVRNN